MAMDLPPGNCIKREDGGADPAFMLFGKQIKGPLPIKEMKEDLSPRGVDERGTSLATTSSDDDEDMNGSGEATRHEVAMAESKTRKKRHKSDGEDDPMQRGSSHTLIEHWVTQKSCQLGSGGRIEMEKHTNTERGLGDLQARKRQGGLWSRCPRCNSNDTKFCYFNNYNVNQPRHFCKHCQRYWTAGGTLRNVPVGAGKRKNKHALRKEAFFMSPQCASKGMASMEGRQAIHEVKLDPANEDDGIPADADGGICNMDCQIASEASAPINTDLELSGLKRTSLPANISSIQSKLTAHGTLFLHKPHPFHKASLPIRSSPASSGSSKCSEPISQVPSSDDTHPSQRCSKFSENFPNCADGRSRFSKLCATDSDGSTQNRPIRNHSESGSFGLSQNSQIRYHPQSGSSGLSQISAHPQSGSAGLSRNCQISDYPEIGSSGLSADLLSGSPEMRLESGLAKRGFTGSSLREGGILAQLHNNSRPTLDTNSVWPYFHHMYWLGHSPLKPILTPQGWAFPFIPGQGSSFHTPPTEVITTHGCAQPRNPLPIHTKRAITPPSSRLLTSESTPNRS